MGLRIRIDYICCVDLPGVVPISEEHRMKFVVQNSYNGEDTGKIRVRHGRRQHEDSKPSADAFAHYVWPIKLKQWISICGSGSTGLGFKRVEPGFL